MGKGKRDAQQREYEVAKKAFDADWDAVKSTTAYREAWEAVYTSKREKAIKECVINRARKEGVVFP